MRFVLIIFLVCSLLFLPSVFSLEISCFNDGSLIITGAKDKSRVYVGIEGISKFIEVNGKWQDEDFNVLNDESVISTKTFISEEMVFIEPQSKDYVLKLNNELTKFTCPGFEFSCKMINVTILSCYNDGDIFKSRMFFNNYQIDDIRSYRLNNPLKFTFEAKTNVSTFINGPNVVSNSFSDIYLDLKQFNNGNLYTLTWNTEQNIKLFSIGYDECRTLPFYTSKKCNVVKTCLFDNDCKNTEHCNGGFCNLIICDSCQYPKDHNCISYECCEDLACYNDQYCSNNKCVDLECSPGFYVDKHLCEKLTGLSEVTGNKLNQTTLFQNTPSKSGFTERFKDEITEGKNIPVETIILKECGWLRKNHEGNCENVIVYFFKNIFRKTHVGKDNES